jgi:hypothetical protein
MSNAPKDGTPIRLYLREGGDIVGYYTARWWGWVPLLDPWPLIRGNIRFAGWEPIGDEEVRRMRQAVRDPSAAAVAAVPATARPPRPVIVRARKPRPRH